MRTRTTNSTRTTRPRRARRHAAALAVMAGMSLAGCAATPAPEDFPDCVAGVENPDGCYQPAANTVNERAYLKLPQINGAAHQKVIHEGTTGWWGWTRYSVPAER